MSAFLKQFKTSRYFPTKVTNHIISNILVGTGNSIKTYCIVLMIINLVALLSLLLRCGL